MFRHRPYYKMLRSFCSPLLTLLSVLLLTGCGGGGGSVSNPTPTNPVPSISSLSPGTILVGAPATLVTVNGSGFMQTSTLKWNQSARTATYVSATQLTVSLAAADLAATGTGQVVIVNPSPGGGTSNAMDLAINNPSPQISGVSPSSVTTASVGSTVTITGTGFVAASTVTWKGSTHAATVSSSTQITLTLQAADVAAVGSAQIAVVNPTPGGGAAAPGSISIVYPVPTVTSFSPSSIVSGTVSILLTVNGTGFIPTSVVLVNGATHATTYVSATTLTVTVVAGDLGVGSAISIAVYNGSPGGGSCPPVPLPITSPYLTLSTVYPPTIAYGSPDTQVYLNGTGFSDATTVNAGGIVLTPGGWGAQNLFVTLPASLFTTVGSLSITVSDPVKGTSNALTITVPPNPAPVLNSLSPSAAALGGGDFTLTVNGSNFVPTSVVQWNGSPRPTTPMGSSQLSTTLHASDIATLGNNSVSVVSPAPGGGTTTSLPFTIYLGVPASDLVYNPANRLLYAAVPSSGGPLLGNSIVPIDPYTGILGTPIWVGSEPAKLAISSDGSSLWVSLNGVGAIREVNLNTQTAGLQFSLGGGAGVYNPPFTAQALTVMPGSPHTIAVAAPIPFIYSSTVTIYDSGVARAIAGTGTIQCCNGVTGLAFNPAGSKLYEAGSGYGVASVDSTGITAATSLNSSANTNALDVENGIAYLTSGVVLNADTGVQLGVFSVGSNQNASGPVIADATIGEGFVLTTPNYYGGYQINAYDLSTFVAEGSIPVGGVSYNYTAPSALRRWGQDGLAFTNGSQVYILRSPLVRDLSSSLADLQLSANAPATGTTGTNLTYTLTATNAGPVAATGAIVTDTPPTNAILQNVVPSQGACRTAAVITCDLGNLNSGNSATISITVTPLVSATLTNTATASAPQGDPNSANNTVVSTTAVTGISYNPPPAVTSISPAFVQSASGAFTLTVNGSGFNANSAVQINSTAVPTTLVDSTQLTASVPGSSVATMGWAWISVATPTPGGGTSSSVPLTTYSVLSLDINRLNFDPYTRKLYATVPSTATQVTGNSLVSIDPASASIGTPLNVGSEPTRMAETSDGQYLYIGLNGANSLTRVDLTTSTQGAVYPLIFSSYGTPTQVSARDLAVPPGNNNLLAIDTGSWGGIGLFDITGSTGTARPNLTGPYTGSNLAFADSNTLYSYDSDTTGAELNRWSITSTGLTLNNNTGYTLNGIGGFGGGYQILNGLLYGFAGGVADPTTTPPAQLGQFLVTSAQGSGQSVEGTGVSANPGYGRVFIMGETLAGSADPVLLSFDSNKYVLLAQQLFRGAPQGQDLVRWGRDGLAWHSSLSGAFGNNTAGSGKLFLMRGPFVLPQWGTANPTAVLTTTTPTSTSAGGGNFVLTVTGSGFVPGAVLTWNGTERTTTYVSATQLTVAIPASDISQPGTATLVVNNPGSSNSNLLSFSVN